MARIRTIKPEFFTSEDIVSLTPLSRLFYQSLWCEADREGRMEWKPRTFKLRYFPGDNCDIESMAQELIDAGLVIVYEANGKQYAEVPSFKKHQVINNREAESEIPPRVTNENHAPFTRESGVLAEGKEGKGRERKEGTTTLPSADVASDADDHAEPGVPPCPIQAIVDAYHRLMPTNPRVRLLDDTRRRAISARWRQASQLTIGPFGYKTRDDGLKAWEQFFEICNESDFLTGKAPPGVGRDKSFVADLDFLTSPKGFKGCIENKYHRGVA